MKKYFIIGFIVVFGIAGISGYMTHKKINKNVESMENYVEQKMGKENKTQEEIKENIDTISINEDTIKNEIEEETTNKNKVGIIQNNKAKKAGEKKNVNNISEEGKKEKQQSNCKLNNNTQVEKTPQNTQVKNDIRKKEQEEKETKQEENKNEENKKVEEYKINQTKINEMKTIINNNPSDDMKLYGYQIIVDSSIVELTNEFTFTEKRVKDKIVYKFGTIRIYAQDRYLNGKYVTTECYII